MWLNVLAIFAAVTSVLSLWVTLSVTRKLGVRDPSGVPAFLRRALNIHELPPDIEGAFAQVRPGRDRVAFVVNPSKRGISELREAIYRAASIRYLPEPMWLYTTVESPGSVQAREAVEGGADAVVAVGGDGTLRAVAEGIAGLKNAEGKPIPLGIIPMGTGNVLARNFELPLGNTAALIRIALDSDVTPVDAGWLELEDEHGDTIKRMFLVLAGVGFDAEMVGMTRPQLKRSFGWLAYLWAAAENAGSKRMRATVKVDDHLPASGLMRSVVIANVAKLPGGMQLVPDGSFNDGKLDFATIDARNGIAGWTELFGEALLQGAGLPSPDVPDSWRAGRIDHRRGSEVTVHTEIPQLVQVDGDPIGKTSHVHAWVEPGALHIRIPAKK